MVKSCSLHYGIRSKELPKYNSGFIKNELSFETVKQHVKPKKHLGQHFLNDLSVAERIAGMFGDDLPGYPVLEIGPGMGVLTDFLLQKYKNVSAVEIDRESVAYLKDHQVKQGLHLIEGDFLDSRLDDLYFKDEIILIGNYPYNISSQIAFKVLDHINRVKAFGGMFQKEVADRMVAGPGSKTYGILSVFLNTWYTCNYEFTVAPHLFTPPPKVQSGVIRCIRKDGYVLPCSRSLFFDVVKTAFNQRRKTLRNALHKFNLDESHEFAKLRAEQLSSEDFISLTLHIHNSKQE